jgi:CheY-like chemotaxis protein
MKTILIVDDDVDDKDFLCEVLVHVDPTVKCIWAQDGVQALNLLSNENFLPDYIFLDLNMPRMGGKQCLEKIKDTPRISDVPVIIYTTSKLREAKIDAMRLRDVHFLTKPTTFAELQEKVSHVLQNKWAMIDEV